MNLNFDISKPYFEEIKQVSKTLNKIIETNKNNSFITKIQSFFKNNDDIIKNFPIFFKNILMPISYERIIGKQTQRHYDTPAVGKWFGTKGWKNISYYDNQVLIRDLKQEHINLIPNKDKRIIAQDFFDYSRIFKKSKDNDNDNEYTLNIPMNINTTLYKFNWVQIRDMSKTYKINSYYNSTANDNDFNNFIYPKESNINAIITEGIISYNTISNIIKIAFISDGLIVEEVYIKSTFNEEGIDDSYMFLSEKLFNWEEFLSSQKSKLHEIFLDNIEILLTPEIKQAVNSCIDKQKTIQEDWTKLQTKYAHLLLQKGNI